VDSENEYPKCLPRRQPRLRNEVVTERLNVVYGDGDDSPSDEFMRRAARLTNLREHTER
jgi:hypothetical protein